MISKINVRICKRDVQQEIKIYLQYSILINITLPLTTNCLNGWIFSGAFFLRTMEMAGISPSLIVTLHVAYARDFPFLASKVKIYLIKVVLVSKIFLSSYST